MPNVFSRRTLEVFEDASASIPLRAIDSAFEAADVRLGEDPGGLAGTRRTRFRRWVAGVDQAHAHELAGLCRALGTLISEVATSKVDFLVQAAERDGFVFADGAFVSADVVAPAIAVTRVEELALIDEGRRRLRLLANQNPTEAARGAVELVDSVCRTILRHIGKPVPRKPTDLVELAESTLTALGTVPIAGGDASNGTDAVGRCLVRLGSAVAVLGDLRDELDAHHRRNDRADDFACRTARLAVDVAATFAGFVAETYAEQVGEHTGSR